MTFNQITVTRLHELDALWGATLNISRGPAPRSLGLCHMLAETNGITPTTTQSATRRDVGLMRLSLQDTLKLGYAEQAAQDPRTNIYLWCKLANLHAEFLHQHYPDWWTSANLDFWQAVRLVFIMGRAAASNLFTTVGQANPSYRSTAAVINWIRTHATPTVQFGTFNRVSMLQLANHLDATLMGMKRIDGPRYVAAHFSERVPPVNNDDALYANTQGYVSHQEFGA